MVLDYLYFRHVLGVGGPIDTVKIESILVHQTLTEKILKNILEQSWEKTLGKSPDRYKWKGEKTIVVNELHRLLFTEEHPICKLSYRIDNYPEFNAVALKWEYPANGPIRSHEAAFNHYFDLAINEYLFK